MTGPGLLRIGTRRSDLARWQAETVAAAVRAQPGAPPVEIVFIETEGDHITDVPLHAVPGKAFFTKEIEAALLVGTVDVAVHSLKDLATRLPDGLDIGAVLAREDPRDALLTRDGGRFEELPPGACVGTSSLRRRAQLARWRPDVVIADLRGNVPTRIAKLEAGEFDAIVIAAAGVIRLGRTERVSELLSRDRVLPAVAQGAVAVQLRASDAESRGWVAPLDHAPTRAATAAERALLRALEGGCQVPVGGLATVANGSIEIAGVVCSLDGTRAVHGAHTGPVEQADAVGTALAEDLLARGAREILAGIRLPGERA